MKVIALTGRAGSGKDTAAFILQLLTGAVPRQFPNNNQRLEDIIYYFQTIGMFNDMNGDGGYLVHKFAYPVYQVVSILTGRPISKLMTDEFKKDTQVFGMSGREFLQKVGTECFRNVIGETVWCDVMRDKIAHYHWPGVIVSDLRFLNEASFLQENYEDLTIIKLVGRDSGVSSSHQSESELERIRAPHIVHNAGTYLDLLDNLTGICTVLDILNCKYTFK